LRTDLPTSEDVKRLRRISGLNQDEFASKIGRSREWISKLETGAETVSAEVALKLHAFAREIGASQSEVHEPSLSYSAPRNPRDALVALNQSIRNAQPWTRSDCENYIHCYLDAAAASADPNAFPYIGKRLMKEFPLDDWEHAEQPKLEER
jgi:transcriptional regulator with XRE-family HTH domain